VKTDIGNKRIESLFVSKVESLGTNKRLRCFRIIIIHIFFLNMNQLIIFSLENHVIH
jgi:hypothetical protein